MVTGGAPGERDDAMGQAAVKLRPGASVHKHVQVREYVRSLISGAPPGTPAPSERELVQLFGVARMTVRQALDALVAEGLLERIPGRGTFVADTRVDHVPRLTGFAEEMNRRGMSPGSKTLLARLESAGPGVARALEIGIGDPVVHWQRLRLADAAPMCVEDAYLAAALVPGLLETLPQSLYAELERRNLAPTWGEDSVDAGLAQEPESRLLGLPVGHPVLRVARRAFCDRSPIEVSRSTYRADRFTMWVPLTRIPQPRHH
jgi:GntR family transcriptional regulator